MGLRQLLNSGLADFFFFWGGWASTWLKAINQVGDGYTFKQMFSGAYLDFVMEQYYNGNFIHIYTNIVVFSMAYGWVDFGLL